MKKIFLVLLTAILSIQIFAQNNSYKNLVKKAKEHESKEEWAYAMGCYVDAIIEDPTNSGDAGKRLDEIISSIKEGNPGVGKYNGAKLLNGWKNLLQNAEQYWSEYCPYSISIGDLQILDSNGSTADYGAPIKMELSKKYTKIMGAISYGLEKGSKPEWGLPKGSDYYNEYDDNYYYIDSLDYWPCVSYSKPAGATKSSNGYYPVVKTSSSFLTNSVPTYSGNSNYNSSWNYKTKKYDYTESGFTNYYNAFAFNNAGYDGYCLYDVKVKIVDKDGKELVAGQRYLPKKNNYSSENQYVTFKGLSKKIYDKIDAGEASPVLEGLYMQYGYQPMTDYINYREDRTSPTFKKNLPEQSIDVSKVQVLYHGKKDLYKTALRIIETDPFFRKFYEDKTSTETDDCMEYRIPLYDYCPEYKRDVIKNNESIYSNDEELSHYESYWYNDYDDYKEPIKFYTYELANRLSDYDCVSPYYDDSGKVLGGEGYSLKSGIEENYYGDKIYSFYFYRKVDFTDAEKKLKKDAALESAQAYIDLEDDIKNSCTKFGVDFCSNASRVESLIGELKKLKQNNGKTSEINSALNSLDAYISSEKYPELKKEFEALYEKCKDAQSIYESQKKRYDNVYATLRYDSEYNSYGKAFYYSDNTYSRGLVNLKSAIDSNKIKDKAKYRDEVASYDFTKMETRVTELKNLINEAQKTYDKQKARYDAVYEILKNDSAYSSYGKIFCYSSNTYSNGLSDLKSELRGHDYDDIKKYATEVAAYDFSEMEAKVEEYKTKSSDAQSVYDSQKKRYDAVYSVLKNDSDYNSSGKIFYYSSNTYSDGLSNLKSAIASKDIVRIAKCRDVVAAYDFSKMEAKIEEYKTKSSDAQSIYDKQKARYDAVYAILKNDSAYNSYGKIFYNSTNKYTTGFKNLKSAIDSNNIVAMAKYRDEVAAFDFAEMEAKVEEYKIKSSDAQSIYDKQKSRYDAVYEILKNDTAYNSYGKIFYNSTNKYTTGFKNLKSAIDSNNIVSIAKYRDEVAAFDFAEMEAKVTEYKENSKDSQSIYNKQKSRYDAVYGVLKNDTAYNSYGKIFYNSTNKYLTALQNLKSAIDSNNIVVIAKSSAEFESQDFKSMEAKVEEYKTRAKDAQSIYEEQKKKYEYLYSFLMNEEEYKSEFQFVRNNADKKDYTKYELALMNLKSAIDSNNLLEILKHKEIVASWDFSKMENKASEYENLLKEAQSLYDTQKDRYDTVYAILKNDKEFNARGRIFFTPNNIYAVTLNTLNSAIENKNYKLISMAKKEAENLDFEYMEEKTAGLINVLNNGKNVYEQKKNEYDIICDLLKDDKTFKIDSSYVKSIESLKKAIENKNFEEVEKLVKSLNSKKLSGPEAKIGAHRTKGIGAEDLYNSLMEKYNEIMFELGNNKSMLKSLNVIKKSLDDFKIALDSKSIVRIGEENQKAKKISFKSYEKPAMKVKENATAVRQQLADMEEPILKSEEVLKNTDYEEKVVECRKSYDDTKMRFDSSTDYEVLEPQNKINVLYYDEVIKAKDIVESRSFILEKLNQLGYEGKFESESTEQKTTFVVENIIEGSTAFGQGINNGDIIIFDDVITFRNNLLKIKKITTIAFKIYKGGGRNKSYNVKIKAN